MKRIRVVALARALLAAASVLAMGVAQAGSTVRLDGPASVALGDVFNVVVNGSDFEPIIGGGLDVSFSAGLLELQSISIDPDWNFWPELGTVDNSAGTLVGLAFTIQDPSFSLPSWTKSGSFAIATLQFLAKAPGDATISLATNEFWDFSTPEAVVPAVAFADTTLQIASVPEPAAWFLMLGGLGLVGARMSRRAV